MLSGPSIAINTIILTRDKQTMRSSIVILASILSISPALADKTCKQQVDEAFEKLREHKAFRLETEIVNEQGKLKMQADYVLPDRMHQKVELSTGGGPMEMIVIGNKAWSNQGQGWAALPQNFADAVAGQIKETVAKAPTTMTEFKCLGDKEFEGKTYAVYQGLLATPIKPESDHKGPHISNLDIPKQQNVYVDKTSGLPVRNIVNPVTAPDQRLFDGKFSLVEGLKIEEPEIKQN